MHSSCCRFTVHSCIILLCAIYTAFVGVLQVRLCSCAVNAHNSRRTKCCCETPLNIAQYKILNSAAHWTTTTALSQLSARTFRACLSLLCLAPCQRYGNKLMPTITVLCQSRLCMLEVCGGMIMAIQRPNSLYIYVCQLMQTCVTACSCLRTDMLVQHAL